MYETSFHNTIGKKGEDLARSEKKAVSQEDKILAYMKSFPGRRLTPFQIAHAVFEFGNMPPITSVRRAITNLTKQGVIIKSPEMYMGEFGEQNHTWYYPKKEGVQTSLDL